MILNIVRRGIYVSAIVMSATGIHVAAQDTLQEEIPRSPGLRAVFRSVEKTVQRTSGRLSFWLEPDQVPASSIESGPWTGEWSGMLETRSPGEYHFAATVIGQFELTVDGHSVLTIDSKDSDVPVHLKGSPVELPYGPVSISAKYTSIPNRPAVLRLFRQLPDGFDESILPSAYWHEAPASRDELSADQSTQLISRKRCFLCHRQDGESSAVPRFDRHREAPLNQLVRGLQPGWIRTWIRRHESRAMDGSLRLFAEGTDEEVDLAAAATYLSSLSDNAPTSGNRNDTNDHDLEGSDPQSRTDGRETFAKLGCIACHRLSGEAVEDGLDLIPLDQVPNKYTIGQLHRRLFAQPDKDDPSLPHLKHNPQFDLGNISQPEIESIERFLMTPVQTAEPSQVSSEEAGRNPSSEQTRDRFREMVADPIERAAFDEENEWRQRIRLGHHVVGRRGCLQCHGNEDQERQPVKSWTEILNSTQTQTNPGCLSKKPLPGIPHYQMSDQERTSLVTELTQLAHQRTAKPSDAPLDRLEAELRRLGCIACHERHGRPSPFQRRIELFASLGRDKTLRDISPPPLDAVGERLTRRWLEKVLLEHVRSRPWLQVKMPRYDVDDVRPLIDLLVQSDGIDPRDMASSAPPSTEDALKGARQLIGRTGLNCVGCHDFGSYQATGVRAPDLTTAADRLRFDWFRRWLHDPQSISPGTRMPTAFQSGLSTLPTVLEGREEPQVNAVWAYLAKADGREPPLLPTIGNSANPSWETDTPRPADRPLIWHGFMPGHAGLKAIAIGFPTGPHFAWNTETCRLTRVWGGAFIRQSGWDGSGKGDVHANAIAILGQILWKDDELDSPIQFVDANGDIVPVTTADLRFDECWTTRSRVGLAWRVKLNDQHVRMEMELDAIPELGKHAFRRRVVMKNLPTGVDVLYRVDSLASDDRSLVLPESPQSGWIRIPHAQFDWLVLLREREQTANWISRGGTRTNANRDGTRIEPKGLLVRFPFTPGRDQIEFHLFHATVDRGGELKRDWQPILRREFDRR